MTAIQIATEVIDKLQEDNRISLETLHKAQENIRFLEHQLREKDKIIKVLEDRVRTGTNSFLEMNVRQKELTIKNLELQIQKLLRENEDLEYQINAVKADICARCETKLLLGLESEKKTIKKTLPKETSSTTLEKKLQQKFCPDRQKTLERIIEHKDKRITHLSKEVCRLNKTEKELTDKIYRLTKLLPLSHASSETLTDCLLKEIQLLESQIQSYRYNNDELPMSGDMRLGKLCKEDLLVQGTGSSLKPRNKKMDVSKGNPIHVISNKPSVVNPSKEDDLLLVNLHKLYNDVYELKQQLEYENEKFHEGLSKDLSKKEVLKSQWDEIVLRLNDIAKNIQQFTPGSADLHLGNDSSILKEKEHNISRLQERLRESLQIVSEYEDEIKDLKENVQGLKQALTREKEQHEADVLELKQLIPQRNVPYSVESSRTSGDMGEVDKLREMLEVKNVQLENAQSHIRTCQRFIEELQKKQYYSENPTGKLESSPCYVDVEKAVPASSNECQKLQKKLQVAERNIKSCEETIECLQKSLRLLKQENSRLESELHMAKTNRLIAEASDHQNKSLQKQLDTSQSEINSLRCEVKNLKDKLDLLAKENSELRNNLVQPSLNQIKVLKENAATLQDKLNCVQLENQKLQEELKERMQLNNLTKLYDDDVISLKNQLAAKEDENINLKESLRALENKALEMNYYRKSLHQEIEKLCTTLAESSDEGDSFSRRDIYKAAALRSAQALLRLDEDFNLQSSGDRDHSSALEEMKHQVSVYVTEVARIHELITIQERERETLLKEYLALDDLSGVSASAKYQSRHNEDGAGDKLRASPPVGSSNSLENLCENSSTLKQNSKSAKSVRFEDKNSSEEIKALRKELEEAKSVTSYLLSNCSQLEEAMNRERTEHAKCIRELEVQNSAIKDLKFQLNAKNSVMKKLNTMIEMMRSKECYDDIAIDQLKAQIKLMVEENQRVFERVTATQAELAQCKEENSRIQNDIDTLKRQLLNEKYEHAKVNNELKHLRLQLADSQSLNDS